MLERKNAEPLYVQAQNILLARIENEEYKVGGKIPSESELCKEFGISRMTVRAVLTELVREGKLHRVQGKGTFVSEPKFVASSMSYVGIREQLEKQGYDVSTSVISIEVVSCPPTVAKVMGVRMDEQVYDIQRLRRVKDVPLSIHRSYVPVSLCPGLENHDFCNEQMCKILSKDYNMCRTSVTETLESTLASEEEAQLLHIGKGYPLLRLCDLISDRDGHIFEYSTVVFRGDKLQIRLQYGI